MRKGRVSRIEIWKRPDGSRQLLAYVGTGAGRKMVTGVVPKGQGCGTFVAQAVKESLEGPQEDPDQPA